MTNKDLKNNILHRVLSRSLESFVLFPVFAVLILGVIWIASFKLIQIEAAAVERGADDSALKLVEIYEAQMIHNLRTIDQTLRTIAYAYEVQGEQLDLSELRDKGLLPSSLIFTVSIANSSGDVFASMQSEYARNISDQGYFRQQQRRDSALLIVSETALETGKQKLQFNRRLSKPDGTFSGIAMVSVDPSYFTSGYEHARLGEHGVLGLITDDGVFLTKRTGDKITVGQTVDRTPFMADQDADVGNRGSILLTSSWDGVERYLNARQLYGFPLSVVVGLSRAEQMEDFQQQKHTYLWAATAVSALLIIVAVLLTRLSWQLAKSRRRTRKDQETYYAASEASLDAVFVLRCWRNAEGSITDFILDNANDRGARLFGKTKAEVLGKKLCDLLPQSRNNGILDEFVYVALTGEIQEREWETAMRKVKAKWLYRQVMRVEDGVVVIVRDISERKETEARISHMAHHDALTGLPNRTLLEDRINQAIMYAQRYEQSVAVVFMDLDNFKLINDSLGHKAGDELLKVVADRMQNCVRQTDTVVRLGGDEFVIVLHSQSQKSEFITPALQKLREAIADPIYIDDQKLEVTSSMGLALYPGDGGDSDTLLMNADAAMYQAKALGRNNYQFYTTEMNAKIHEKLKLQEDLRNAISRREFFLVYQPQVDLRSGRIIGVEALIRWNHPVKGLVSPLDFIGLAEETGLIVPIGDWVIDAACRQNRLWQDAGLPPVVISVNISARQFKENNLTREVRNALEIHGVAARHLEIEVTESLIMQDLQQAVLIMRELQAMGIQLSIDDFGIGYSSLSALKSFPIARLKLDKSFVRDLPDDEEDKAIAKAVILLGHELDLKVLAEGVESAAQLAFLRDNGCDEMQGYYFSKPVSPDEIEALLRQENAMLLTPSYTL